MEIFEKIEDIKDMPPCALALGNFDGVHLGHQELIKKTVEKAKELGLKPGVFTFSNHPKNLLPKAKPVKNILYNREKAEIIEGLGVDYMFNIEFTQNIMTMNPENFVKNLLIDKFNMKYGFCGFNYHFGYMAEGNVEILEDLGKKYDYSVKVIPPFLVNDNIVSSSLIRTIIAAGQVDKCKEYMGRYYEIAGDVVVGNKLGRTLGFPTSNLVIDEAMVTPPNGVYVTLCTYNGIKYPSVTNVGKKPTIGDYNKNVETHIFNFNKELYGKKIIVEFLVKTRDEVKFDDLEELSEQIIRDCHEAQIIHKELGTM